MTQPHDYPNVLSRLVNEPLLAHPSKAEVVVGAVLRRQGVEVNVQASAEFVQAPKAGPLQEKRMVRGEGMPFLFDQSSGIAVISVTGSLAHRQGFIGRSSGVMGYDGIGAQFQAALDQPMVRGIMLDMHTPGGEVHGAFQLADRIAAARGRKPVIALSDEMAYSAGYLIASAAEEVWLASSTAGVGSIGAVVVHVSYQQMLEAEGVKATVFTFGDRKADGNPFQDLAPDAADRIQARIDYLGREFVSRVARWRGISEKAVVDTQAATFVGQEGVRLRLADGIADPTDVFRAFAQDISRRPYGRPLQ
jgi:signal peptide peptidase SppA